MMEVAQQPTQEDRIQRVHQMANDKFRHEPDWVTFYREVLGVDGIIDQLFPGIEQRTKFQKTNEYAEIQQMLAKLREKNRGQKQPDEATRVITVRLPQSLHEALRHEAHNHKTSMNKLCISKLLQVIADELVPSDFERHDDDEEPLQARVTRPQPAVQHLPAPRPMCRQRWPPRGRILARHRRPPSPPSALCRQRVRILRFVRSEPLEKPRLVRTKPGFVPSGRIELDTATAVIRDRETTRSLGSDVLLSRDHAATSRVRLLPRLEPHTRPLCQASDVDIRG